MKVFVERVRKGEDVNDLVLGSGYCGMIAEEDGYKVSIGIFSVFIRKSDMKVADDVGDAIWLERYGD